MRAFNIFLLLSLGFPTFASKVILKAVGKVNGQFITSRQVQIYNIVVNLLNEKETQQRKHNVKEIDIEDPQFKSEATSFVLDYVVALEAENFSVSKVDQKQVENDIQIVNEATKGNSYWKSISVDESELKKIIINRLSAKNFIQFKTNSMSSIISDQEAKKYFDDNKEKFGQISFVNMSDKIKSYLSRQQMEARLKEWFEVLRKKYDVRIMI